MLNQSVSENVAQGVEDMKQVYRNHPELHRELQAQLNSNINAVLESSVKMIESIGDIGRHVSQVDVNSLSHHVTIIQKYFVTYRSRERWMTSFSYFFDNERFIAVECVEKKTSWVTVS